jgi:hypothetical protein
MSLAEQGPPRGNPNSPEGWYDDPLGSGNQRYWNGRNWELRVRQVQNDPPRTQARKRGVQNKAEPASAAMASPSGTRGLIRRHPFAVLISAVVLALIVGAGIGAVGNQTRVDDLEDQVANLKQNLADERAESEEAKRQAGEAVSAAARERSQLETREADVAQRETEVGAAEQTLEQNTIPDGVWESGRDFEPGLYRAQGGAGCYWAELRSADTFDIATNGLGGGTQTVEIDSPFFETRDCGEWTKIG